ncbi:tetratricopeptide repeat-containing glycosyltransferase family 2 protein [Paenibacillus brevis]|uniref:Glycosyltransferase n=1 Tax=Paenibacillus brevis TaxID=2841508 RepID=A0ABS6FL80_9BACL|nr:glycosyltransferase [Paenibacillus brevis]MBU5670959.1 glycosyltransferase [Paenibacillus brevis]
MEIPGISLCMIVKDEAELIERAIIAAKPLVEEIVIVDTGSSDSTPNIARDLGAKVFYRQWNNNFAEMRNFSIQQATQPYVLVIDADEVIVERDMDILQALFRKIDENPGSVGAITVLNETVSGDISVSMVPRIFPRNFHYSYKGKIHEQINFRGKPIQHTYESSIKAEHLGYTQSQILKKDKYERNLALLMQELAESSDRSYIHFQIGRTYFVMKSYVQAEHFLNKCIEVELKNEKRAFLSTALLTLGYSYIYLQKFDALQACYKLALDLFPDYTDLYFMYGVGLIESRSLHAFREIPVAFKKCIEMGEASRIKYETVTGVGSFKAHYNLALYYELNGDLQNAMSHYQYSSRDGYVQAKERLDRLILRKGLPK